MCSNVGRALARQGGLKPAPHLVFAALLLIGCSSAAPDSKKATAPLNEPEIKIIQLSNIAGAARHITGAISVQYRIDVANRAMDDITLKRVDMQSIGYGAYILNPVSHPFELVLKPGETKSVQLWAPARIDDPTIVGANGPVTVRLTVHYDTRGGSTQSTVVQQVHASPIVD